MCVGSDIEEKFGISDPRGQDSLRNSDGMETAEPSEESVRRIYFKVSRFLLDSEWRLK